VPNRAVVITVSDRCSRGDAVDRSGPAVIDLLVTADATLIHREVVPDEVDRIRAAVLAWIGRCELVVTTGGTGIAERDVTPEAILPLIEKHLPGFGEVMRLKAFDRLPQAILSRSGAGTARNTLVVWLPGSPKGAAECMEWLATAIRHACDFLRGATPHS
jgi:molybdenum cofactor synthesis domain-containing protein